VNEKIGFNDYFYKQSHILSNIASTINLIYISIIQSVRPSPLQREVGAFFPAITVEEGGSPCLLVRRRGPPAVYTANKWIPGL
jgi:hypothetical protein